VLLQDLLITADEEMISPIVESLVNLVPASPQLLKHLVAAFTNNPSFELQIKLLEGFGRLSAVKTLKKDFLQHLSVILQNAKTEGFSQKSCLNVLSNIIESEETTMKLYQEGVLDLFFNALFQDDIEYKKVATTGIRNFSLTTRLQLDIINRKGIVKALLDVLGPYRVVTSVVSQIQLDALVILRNLFTLHDSTTSDEKESILKYLTEISQYQQKEDKKLETLGTCPSGYSKIIQTGFSNDARLRYEAARVLCTLTIFETERKTILETPQSLALICSLAPTKHEVLHDAFVSALSALASTHIYELTKADSLSTFLPAFVEPGPKENKEGKEEKKQEEDEEKKGILLASLLLLLDNSKDNEKILTKLVKLYEKIFNDAKNKKTFDSSFITQEYLEELSTLINPSSNSLLSTLSSLVSNFQKEGTS